MSTKSDRILQAAATHLTSVGAMPDDDVPLKANATYKETLAHTFATLRAGTRALEAHHAAHPLGMRAMETPDMLETLDGYARPDREPTQRDLCPTMDTHYDPFGAPPDGWRMAAALRRVNAETAPPVLVVASARRETPMVRDANGIIDPYATALAARVVR